MKLNKNAFPVRINLENAIAKFQKEFDRKGHKITITKNCFYLNIVPFWVCYFDIDLKKNNEYKHISSQVALNSLTNKIQDEFLKLLEFDTPQEIDNISVALEKVDIRIKKSLISKEEAHTAIIKMLSCKYEVDKQNISLSGFEEIYIPIWKCKIDGKEIFLDGVLGKINNFEKINQIAKDNSELFKELLTEIKTPKKFFEYFFNLLKSIFVFLIRAWKIILLLVLIFLVLFYFFF